MSQVAAEAALGPRGVWDGPVIDADVHANVGSIDALLPYLSAEWHEFITERGFVEPPGHAYTYPPAAPSTARELWRPDDDRAPASDIDLLREHVLDAWPAEVAIATCNFGIEFVRHPDFGNALASAINDWLVAEWLDREPRLRCALVVPPRRPADMIREIERVGDHPGFVAVNMPIRSDRLYGNRVWHPLWEAIAARDLVVNMHWGGVTEGPPSPTGWPSWYAEEYAAEQQVYMAQLTSLVGEGVFAAVPSLRVTMAEVGFLWLPSLWWRLEKERRGLRRDVPWANQAVPDLVREHIRFTICPLDPGPPAEVERTLEWLGSEELLLFASDYPHRHDDDLAAFLELLSAGMRRNVMAESARAWYRL